MYAIAINLLTNTLGHAIFAYINILILLNIFVDVAIIVSSNQYTTYEHQEYRVGFVICSGIYCGSRSYYLLGSTNVYMFLGYENTILAYQICGYHIV